jgi:protein-disulfide isomerase
MIYKTYQNMVKAVSAGAALLVLAACGESGNEGSNVVDADALLAANHEVEAEAGIWGDIVYGSEDAPIVVVEYASLTCPHCASFSKNDFPKIKADFIDTGKVRFHYRNYVMNPVDMRASLVARCRDMETTKRLMNVFFARQREWARAEDWTGALAGLARRTVNMSRTEFDRCASNREMITNLTKMTTGALAFNVAATPTIFVNGVAAEQNDYESLKAMIEKASN